LHHFLLGELFCCIVRIKTSLVFKTKTKPFIILSASCRSVSRVGGAHLCVIGHTATCVDVEAVANHLQRCVRLGRPLGNELSISLHEARSAT